MQTMVENGIPTSHRIERKKRPNASLLFTVVLAVLASVCIPFVELQPTWVGVGAISSTLALASVCAIWGSIIRGWLVLLGVILLLLLHGGALSFFSAPDFRITSMFLPLAIAVPVVVTLKLIKRPFGGFQLVDRGASSMDTRLNFGIRDLIALTSIAGVVLALGTAFLPRIPAVPQSASNFDVLLTLLAVAGALSAITLTEVWTIMGHSSQWKVPVSLAIVAVAFVGACWGLPHVDRWIWASAIGATVSASCVLLYLLRLEGWCFVSSFRTGKRTAHVKSSFRSIGDV